MFEKFGEVVNSHLSGSLILLLLFSITFIAVVAYIFVYKPRKPSETEGFLSVSVPVGTVPTNCMNSIPELAAIVDKIKGAEGVQAQDSEDFREFSVLADKLACMKADLTSGGEMIRASINQPYLNTHDRQPVVETLTQCFSKTMPPRDLELVFDLYLSRGVELIKRIGVDCAGAEREYRKVVGGIYQIAKERSLNNPAAKKLIDVNGVPRGDFAAYELGGASM
jgi:hypothetical protein